MHCWFLKDVSSIISIMLRDAGHLFDGTRLEQQHAKTEICKCAALLCFCHAEFHCSLELNSFAARNISRVSLNLDNDDLVNLIFHTDIFVKFTQRLQFHPKSRKRICQSSHQSLKSCHRWTIVTIFQRASMMMRMTASKMR